MKSSPKPKVFITGVTGQDGALLAKLLIEEGKDVYGGFRRGSDKFWRLQALGIQDQVSLLEFQLQEPHDFFALFQAHEFEAVYHLAGDSFVADSFRHPIATVELNTIAVCNLLEAVRLISPKSRVFFASSSEIFGRSSDSKFASELSIKSPVSPYGISKLAADFFVGLYRETYGLFVCTGILFNHESALRGNQFVTRKITSNLARIKAQCGAPMKLGNLDSAKDWGSAHDYVVAMNLMLGADDPRDFVVATGRVHTVREFLTLASQATGFDPQFEGKGLDEICLDSKSGLVLAEVDSKFFRPVEMASIAGDSSKITSELGWTQRYALPDIVEEMVRADIERWEAGLLR